MSVDYLISSFNFHDRTYDVLLGTVQGSVLGPVLYAIFISPLFDLEDLSAFADDNYAIKIDRDLTALKISMENTIANISNWMRSSGLKVNEEKTKICIFSRLDTTPVVMNINRNLVQTKKEMNVLGITFDSKLQWNTQVINTISKANKDLNWLNLSFNSYKIKCKQLFL